MTTSRHARSVASDADCPRRTASVREGARMKVDLLGPAHRARRLRLTIGRLEATQSTVSEHLTLSLR